MKKEEMKISDLYSLENTNGEKKLLEQLLIRGKFWLTLVIL